MTTDDGDLDRSIGALYGAAPEAFVAEREALAKELRAAKRRDDAARVHALTRPTVAAWAVNQAVRRAPELAEQLLLGARDLVEAQRQAVEGGDATWLRKAQAERRGVVRRLVDVAREALAEHDRKADPHLDEVTSILEAASLDPESMARLRLGQLATAPHPASGAGQLDPFAALFAPAVSDPQPAAGSRRARTRRSSEAPPKVGPEVGTKQTDPIETDESDRRRGERSEAESALEQALAEAEKSRERSAQLSERSEAAATAVEQARATIADLERQISDARQSLDDAEADKARTAAGLQQAEQYERSANGRVDQARGRLDALGDGS
jgi:hypothetical protein